MFILALVFLGTAFTPIVDRYLTRIPAAGLYWINIVSAVLDNATVTAAEITPRMSEQTITTAPARTADRRRHADPRQHPQHHLRQQADDQEPRMGPGRHPARNGPDDRDLRRSAVGLGSAFGVPPSGGFEVFRRCRLHSVQTQDFKGYPDYLTRLKAELQT